MSTQDVTSLDGDGVDELERSIERTQGAMSGTLDAIQEKLNPNTLIEQVRGPVEDTSDHIVAEVQRAVRESLDHIIAEARGPITEMGEQLITRATSAAEEATDHILDQARATATEATDHILEQARATATEAATDIVTRTGEAVRAATIGKVEHMVQTVSETTRNRADSANEMTKGFGATVLGTIESNPLPAALTAIGLSWLFLKRPKSAATRATSSSYSTPGYGAAGAPSSAASRVGDTVGGAAGAVGDTVGSAAGTVGDTVGGAAGAVGDALGTTAGAVGGALGTTAGAVGDTVGSAAGAVGSTVGQAPGAAADLATGTWEQAQRLATGFQTLARQNPLAVGAASLAVGAAIGLAIPETPQESQLLGGARDTLMDKAVGATQDVMQKVGTVAQKAESAAESAVKDEAHTQGLTV